MTIDDDLLKTLGPVDTVIYTVVATNSNITQREIALRCNMSVRAVVNVLQRLEYGQYISIKVNKPHPNTYEVIHKEKNTQIYGIFGNVRLSSKEYQTLIKTYPKHIVENYIQILDSYIENNPNVKCKSHAAELVKWMMQDDAKHKHYKNGKPLSEIKKEEQQAEEDTEMMNRYLSLMDRFGQGDE